MRWTLRSIGATVLTAGVLAVAATEFAAANWHPTTGGHAAGSGSSTGTEGDPKSPGWDDKIGHDRNTAGGATNSFTYLRAKCNPCPECPRLPYVAYSYTVTWKITVNGQDQAVGVPKSGTYEECACPCSPKKITAADPVSATATKATVDMQIQCGCCDDMSHSPNPDLLALNAFISLGEEVTFSLTDSLP